MIRILLYTPEPTSALGLSSLLKGNSDLALMHPCDSIGDVTAYLDAGGKPDIILLDLTSDVNFALLKEIKRISADCKILLWVNTISTELAFQVMGLGVRGIVRKSLPVETLIECLAKVSQGAVWFDKTLTDGMLSARKVLLTRREGQLVTLLSQGLKNKQVATVLGVSENTVKVYLSRLYAKIGVADRFELALFGLRNVAAGESRMDQSKTFSVSLPGPVQGLRSLVMV